MALGRNARTDKLRLLSSHCSTAVIIVFVTFGLVGVWMMASPLAFPWKNIDFSQVGKSNLKEPLIETVSQPFEDSQGDLTEDAMSRDASINTPQDGNNSDIQENGKFSEQTTENMGQDHQEEKSEMGSVDEKIDLDNTSKTETGNDGDWKAEGWESKTEYGESKPESGVTKTKGAEMKTGQHDDKLESQVEEKMGENQEKQLESSDDDRKDGQADQVANEVFPDGSQSEILNESTTQNGSWSTQAVGSKNEIEVQQYSGTKNEGAYGYSWKVCNVTTGPDYIPCLDNLQAIKNLRSTKHYEHRERHCPEEGPTCLVSLPEGYKQPIAWPKSREMIWYCNVPHTKLVELKGHQNWLKVSGEYLTFPGGGTQFKHGALHYIDFILEAVPAIAWGKRTRVILDVGCGVASFGGFLFDRDVLTMSFAPKDEHEAQVQFALERGIPAISAVMGTKRLPFPSKVFDVVHCARCRVPWHIEGGKLLLELNRVLRPGGYFVWSATPVYKKAPEDVEIWKAMSSLTKKMCWELVVKKKDPVNRVGAAIYMKPSSNECYANRQENEPPLCKDSDDPDAAWNVPLQTCVHKVPVDESERGSQWPEQWPLRMEKPPYWLKNSQVGVYGKSAPEDFTEDYEQWKRVVTKSYLNGTGINWSTVRNVMDMRSAYGGFAAALKNLNVWVMNVVSIDSPDTLPIIYERGLFGIYHDWCESFSTYPRSYDLLHADHLFSKIKKRCNLVTLMAEVDRILRPKGKLIVRDNFETIVEVENMVRSLQWEIRLIYTKDKEGLICVQKTLWRPKETETLVWAIA